MWSGDRWGRFGPSDAGQYSVGRCEGITDDIRKAFVVYLACHGRPMSELLAPTRLDIKRVYEEEFFGMADSLVTCDELVAARERLTETIAGGLSPDERAFLVSVKEGVPAFDLLDIPGIDRLPALQWKVVNIRTMPPPKHTQALEKLKRTLHM